MADFDQAFEKTIIWEGEYVNDPDDPGKETKFGISKKEYPDKDIKNLTLDEARDIYYHDYWLKIGGHYIDSQKIANNIFDFAVNAGIKRAIKLAQKCVKVKKDGIIGNITIVAINMIYENSFIQEFIYSRIKYYIRLTILRREFKKYLFGWLKRTLAFE